MIYIVIYGRVGFWRQVPFLSKGRKGHVPFASIFGEGEIIPFLEHSRIFSFML
jgi:hypothetical protein